MKLLTLIRHAKSSLNQPPLGDFERPLDKRGERDALAMGQRLNAIGFAPDLLLSSPARRAHQTARAIAERIGRRDEDIRLVPALYGAAASTLLREVQELSEDVSHAVIVAHNPGLTDFCNLLAGAVIDHIPTCGVARLGLAVECWSDVRAGSASLVDFDHSRRGEEAK